MGISLVLSSLKPNMKYIFFYLQTRCVFQSVICVHSWFHTEAVIVLMITERCAQTMWVHFNHKSSEDAYHTCTFIHTHRQKHIRTHTHNSLWCPAPVWPSAGMWSEAGNVWAMKACVYAGCSRPSPARGKTDTSTASFALHLSPSPPNPQRDLFSPLALQDFFSHTSFLFIYLFFLFTVFHYFSPWKLGCNTQKWG